MPSLPKQLLQDLNGLEHFDEKAFSAAHSEDKKITSVRLNPFKKVALDFETGEIVKWNSDGLYVPTRPSFTLDPLFHAGCYYPQEAGSMFIKFALQHCLDFTNELRILDVCAAPGGKSTLINSLLNPESLLVANEIIKSRSEILVQNLSKWGTHNTIVTNNDPQRFSELSGFFDALVIDAPCSGSGLFRKQPEAIEEWSPDNVKACSSRQQKILSDVIPSLKTGGILVYSTCSYSVAENEEVVRKLVNDSGMEFIPLPVGEDWGIVETSYGYRFYPHLTQSEGFFCAVLRKRNDENGTHFPKKKISGEATKNEVQIVSQVASVLGLHLIRKNTQFHLLNNEVRLFLSTFEKQFYFKKAGVTVGEIKGKDMVPNQELAWYPNINAEVKKIQLDKETALKFLRKEAFAINENITGLALMCYKEKGLGWAKILPNRINNYLPNELRILK